MNRVLFFVLSAVVILFITYATVQAGGIPMVYNDTTNTTLVDWDMEGDGTAVVGDAWMYGPTSVVTAASEGITARQGSSVMKSLRTGAISGVQLSWANEPTVNGDTTTTSFSIYRDENPTWAGDYAYVSMIACTASGSYDMAQIYTWGTGSGVVQYYDGTTYHTIPGLTCEPLEWNDFTLTHTNGTTIWDITVDGVSASFDAAGKSAATGNLQAWTVENAWRSEFFMDAQPVPEPTVLGLLVTGMIGLLAYARRKRN